jgi:hypothetical protein
VQNLTQGLFKKSTLMYAVSSGVAFGIALGLARIIFDLPLAWLLLPTYLLAVVLTFFSSEEFVNIAWDSAGVTTGPITVVHGFHRSHSLSAGNRLVDSTEDTSGDRDRCSNCEYLIRIQIPSLWQPEQDTPSPY